MLNIIRQSKCRQNKILLIGPDGPPWGGMAVQTQAFQYQYKKHQKTYYYLPLVPAMNVGFNIKKISIKCFKLSIFYIRCIIFLLSASTVHFIINSGKTWILHAPVVCISAKLLRKRLIINYRGGSLRQFIKQHDYLTKPFLKLADCLVVQSHYLSTVLKDFGFGSVIIPNPVQSYFFYKPKKLHKKRYYTIIWARHLESVYDPETVIKAAVLLKLFSSEVFQWILVGDGSSKQDIQNLIQKFSLQSIVKLKGEVNPKSMPGYYRQADLFLNTSLLDNMPNSLLEASASGLPIITTSVGGISEQYTHKNTAIFVGLHDPKAVAKAILSLIHTPTLYNTLSQHAYLQVNKLHWGEIFPKWDKVYDIT